MPSTPFPEDDSTLWDTLEVDGTLYSLLVEFEGTGIKKKIDKRRAAGASGARIRDKGFDLVEVTMVAKAWEREHFPQLDLLVTTLSPRDATAENRDNWHTIAHPVLAQVGLTRFYVEEVDLLKKVSQGLYEQRFKLLEYNPPRSRRNVTRAPTPPADLTTIPASQHAPDGTPPSTITPPSQTSTHPRH